jgi:hypothetical protein
MDPDEMVTDVPADLNVLFTQGKQPYPVVCWVNKS